MKDPTERPQLPIPRFVRGLALPLLPLLLACGGGQAGTDGPQTPPTTAAAASSAAAPGAPASAGSTGPATTTTQGLADAGESQGAKLPDAPGAASAAGGTAKPKGPHDHDPGRGVDDIKAIVNAHRDEAQACYEKGLADHPGIEGNLTITWTMDPKGNVTQTSADASRSDISEPGVIACVSDVIKRIQFAASPGGFETKAAFPFKFRHKKKAAQ